MRGSRRHGERAVLEISERGGAGRGTAPQTDDRTSRHHRNVDYVFEYRYAARTTRGLAGLPRGVPESPSLGAEHGDRQLGTMRLPGRTNSPRRPHQNCVRSARLFGGLAETQARPDQPAADPRPRPAEPLTPAPSSLVRTRAIGYRTSIPAR
jgi:hypothetical protein